MSQEVYVFYTDVADTNIAQVNTVHYQPDLLSEERKEQGVKTIVDRAPSLKPGYRCDLWVHLDEKTTFWDIKVDPRFYMPYSDYMALLPLDVRVTLKENRSSDTVVDTFLDMLEGTRDDSASKGVNPVATHMQEYYEIFVERGYMTQTQVNDFLQNQD